MAWPPKSQREEYELLRFIDNYKSLSHGRTLAFLERREKPDYFVHDLTTGERFGLELTSVYLTHMSVRDEHIPPIDEKLLAQGIPYNSDEVATYQDRLISAVRDKVTKARKDYDLRYPLILSVWCNEHRAIFLDTRDQWEVFVRKNEMTFDDVAPFVEIVFWDLPINAVYSVRPEARA